MPFPVDLDPKPAKKAFVGSLMNALTDASQSSLAPTTAPAVSDAMELLRCACLEERRQAYVKGRLDKQQNWYQRKSRENAQRATWWRLALIVGEVVALLFAILGFAGLVETDLARALAATVGAAAAWMGLRQYGTLERAYARASQDLSINRGILRDAGSVEWAQVVADAEEAISREHAIWRASRSIAGP